MGPVTSKIPYLRTGDIQEEIVRINNRYPSSDNVTILEDTVTDDPGGDTRSVSSGSRTPNSLGGLTPSGSPGSRRGRLDVNSQRASHSPSPSRNIFCEPRKLSAVDSMKAKVLVKTGDQEKAGTDANVYVQLEDGRGLRTSKLKLDLRFRDDLERGKLDDFNLMLPEGFLRVEKLFLTRDSNGLLDDWFCDYIIIQDPRFATLTKHRKIKVKHQRNPGTVPDCGDLEGPKAEYYFPVHRWVSHSQQYEFREFGCSLPQFDSDPTSRVYDLNEKKKYYQYNGVVGRPAQVKKLPSDEQFSDSYFWTFAQEKAKLLGQTKIIEWSTNKWGSFQKFIDVFSNFKKSLGEPRCMDKWSEDKWFGLQRVSGTNCMVIRLCKQIPDNLDVTNDTVSKLLEGFTLEEALEKNKIFICDLSIMEGLKCKDDRVLAVPLALFYLNKEDTLLPIAIQLMQQKAKDNPVFTPLDEPSTWLVAKMYYNNAEAQHHQGVTHLGRTHLLMEGICVCTHRNLSPSHPIFKLLAPHFLFLLAINARGLEKLVSIGGWVDCCMTQGVVGIFELISRGVASYRADIDGVPEREMEERGVLDPEILPYYPYRDDAIPLYAAIQKYVSKVLNHHYDSPSKIKDDHELQMWRKEMTASITDGGAGIGGVPGNEKEGFTELSEVISITTTIIATCSMGHAAANFQQYDQYAFVPNYPGILMSPPPTTKREYSQEDLMALLPNKRMTLDIMVISKLLSNKGTNSLGDFEVQYQYDPVGVEAAKQLRKDLAKVSFEIKKRNVDREVKYDWLDPDFVPNSISV